MDNRYYPNRLDWAFAQVDLDQGEKVLLLCMCKIGYRSGLAFLSQANLARMTGGSVSTVGRALRKLLARELIRDVSAHHRGRATKTYALAGKISLPPIKQSDRSTSVNLSSRTRHDDRQNLESESKDESVRKRASKAQPVGVMVDRLLKNIAPDPEAAMSSFASPPEVQR